MTRYGYRQGFLAVLGIGLFAFMGCTTMDTVVLDVQAVPPSGEAAAKKTERLTVTVTAFEDARPEPGRLGVRHHLWGSETTFTVPGGKPGEVVAKVVADSLKRNGWRTDSSPDITMSGQVLVFSVNAESKVGRTEITVKTKVAVQALNTVDGSRLRMTLTGDGRQQVFWFDPEDAQELASEVLSDSVEKFMANTIVANHVLRLK